MKPRTDVIRVLIAEDSITARELVVAILSADPEVIVVGEAANGVEAVEMTRRLKPDVLTMDIQMPGLDGFEATRKIMSETPTPIVIVSGVAGSREAAASIEALHAGALAILARPSGPRSPDFEDASRHLVQTVKALARVKVVRKWPAGRSPRKKARPALLVRPTRPRVIAIAASTGGPAAIRHLVAALPAAFPVPIVVVQHIAIGFLAEFVSWLDKASPLDVRVAKSGDVLKPGSVYVAPEGHHLEIGRRSRLGLSSSPPVDGFRPSASPLFESVARVFGRESLAIILTGMGRDGLDGLRAVRAAGGQVIAQDESSSVVFGMPGAAIEAGLANFVLPLSRIAPVLIETLKTERCA